MNEWERYLEPLIEQYGKRKHPLEYNNRYQLMVMIILSAQTTDKLINQLAPDFFRAYPSMEELKLNEPEDLYPYISKVTSYRKKAKWLTDIAKEVKDDSGIPHRMNELTRLPGFGRKSANVLIRESGDEAEGVMVDLHVARVAPRLGVTESEKPDKIEKELMGNLPQSKWNDVGMALSYHGREICRPQPLCESCIVKTACRYYKTVVLAQKD